MTKINLNQIAEVRLTEAGIKQYTKYFQGVFKRYENGMDKLKDELTRRAMQDIKEGHYKTELWKIIEIFGAGLMQGLEVPFMSNEVEIYIDNKVQSELVYPNKLKE